MWCVMCGAIWWWKKKKKKEKKKEKEKEKKKKKIYTFAWSKEENLVTKLYPAIIREYEYNEWKC